MSKKTSEIRLLHLSSALTWRGGEQQLAYLAAELRKAGVRQWICCVEGSEMEAFCRKEGFGVFTYRKRFSVDPTVGRWVKDLCRKLEVDILHTHDSHAHTFAVISALFGNRTPLVVHRRVDFPVGRNIFSKWKYNHPAVRRIICTSQGIEEITAPSLKDPSKLTVVHSGIDFARFGLTDEGQPAGVVPFENLLRKNYKVPDDHYVIVNVAAIAPHKDYFTFVNTAEFLLERGMKARFFIIGGDGGEEQAIRRYIKEKSLAEHFVFTGFRTDVPKLLRGADLLLFTSRTEGIGVATLEAFACRVPVVATIAGGVTEVVVDEVTGLVAPVGDERELGYQVELMLKDDELRQELVENAFNSLKKFTKEKTAAGILQVYNEILDSRKG